MTDDVKVKVSGNMALVTGNWTSTTVPSDIANAEPHKDMGRFTNVYEKRGGKWMLVAEHWTEAQHDRKLMEEQVLKMGREYGEMIKRGNVSELEKILADDYIYLHVLPENDFRRAENQKDFCGEYALPKQ